MVNRYPHTLLRPEKTTVSNPTQEEVEYRDIPGFPGYRVGSDGSVWSCLARGNGNRGKMTDCWRLMKCSSMKSKRRRFTDAVYLAANLTKGGKVTKVLVHRLVLGVFGPPCPPGQQCRHLDGNPSNNRLSNLAWGTPTENYHDRLGHGTALLLDECPQAELSENDAILIRELYSSGEFTQKELAKQFGTTASNIGHITRGKSWKLTGGSRRKSRIAGKPLEEEQVGAIRNFFAGHDVTYAEVAKRYGLTQKQASKIIRGKIYVGAGGPTTNKGYRTVKLNAEQVGRIREEFSAGKITSGELAKKYGVDTLTIRRVIKRQSWKHVP